MNPGVYDPDILTEVFRMVYRVEDELMVYYKGLGNPETLRTGELVSALLDVSAHYSEITGGLFDPFYLSEVRPVKIADSLWYLPKGLRFDPGGFIKGFLVDSIKGMADVDLVEYGGSSLFSKGVSQYLLPDGSLMSIKGVCLSVSRSNRNHIYDVRKGTYLKEDRFSFAISNSCSRADMLSTVCLIEPSLGICREENVYVSTQP